ncbi:MAG: 3-deoxy-manno-octulosonate cytidylyltransferase [Bacteriovoracaceae bacterium]|nr:3-deoxy-manno-octulosonate cytidylyltransferase [Bacteriovoracaceae bacterium]
MQSAVVLIPARFQSTRFPGKPLAPIAGISMIERVYNQSLKSGFVCYVVTDDERIEQAVNAFGGKVLRVDDDVPSGSERIALAYQRFLKSTDCEFVVNVQGDEPLLKGEILNDLVKYHQKSAFDVTTLVRPRKRSESDWTNPNVVKAVMGVGGRCSYFSRASVPFERDGAEAPWYQHIGVYCYKVEALLKFVRLPASPLEQLEKLEQLRGMENGLTYGALPTNQKLIGVDSPEDIKKVEEALSEQAQ